jgi:hypothetical protein
LKGSTNQTWGWKQEKNGVQAETMGFAEQQLGLSERMDLNTPKHGKLNRHFSIGTATTIMMSIIIVLTYSHYYYDSCFHC